MAAPRNRGLALALAGIALLGAATFAAYRPPTIRGTNASLDEFSAVRAQSVLEELVGSGVPHPIGSAANASVRNRIVARLRALGYAVELQSGTACDAGVCANPVNIVATLLPRGAHSRDDSRPREVLGARPDSVLLSTHYDSVPAGPGASDDGASVAAVLEIARILAARPPANHPLVLLLSDGEEAGLLGALLFVRDHPLSHQIWAAVNLEARGTSGASLMFETGTANAWLMHLYAAAVARPVTNSLYYVVYKLLPNDTDFTVFKSASYQGYNFAYIGNVGRYHTPLDTVANASLSSIQHQGENGLASVSALLHARLPDAPGAESVFFDVLGRVLVEWPAQRTLPAALLALVLLGAETALLLRARTIGAADILRGTIAILGVLVLAAAASAGLLAALIAIGKAPPLDAASWIAHPWPMHVAAAALPLLAAATACTYLSHRASPLGAWAAAALMGALFAVILAAIAPGASFALVLSSGAAALAGLPFALAALKFRAPGPSADGAAVLPALAMFASAAPLLRFLYMALGSLAWPALSLLLALVAMYLMPLLIAATRRLRLTVIAVSAAGVVGGFALTLVLPTYSSEWPQRINVEYWLDADRQQSHYFASADSARLPPFLTAARFDPVPRPRFAHSRVEGFWAPAAAIPLAAPELTLESRAGPAGSDTTHVDLHLRSPRAAPEAMIVFPAVAGVANATISTATGTVRARLHDLEGGATLLQFVGLPAEGVSFAIDWKGGLPPVVQVMDQSYGLTAGADIAGLRPFTATSSQDGDVTVVHRTVSLAPAAGR